LDVEDAVHHSLMTIREGFEGEVTSTNVELGVVVEDAEAAAGGRFRVLAPTDLEDYLREVE
jgi:20S proteasome subunit alpha 2